MKTCTALWTFRDLSRKSHRHCYPPIYFSPRVGSVVCGAAVPSQPGAAAPGRRADPRRCPRAARLSARSVRPCVRGAKQKRSLLSEFASCTFVPSLSWQTIASSLNSNLRKSVCKKGAVSRTAASPATHPRAAVRSHRRTRSNHSPQPTSTTPLLLHYHSLPQQQQQEVQLVVTLKKVLQRPPSG